MPVSANMRSKVEQASPAVARELLVFLARSHDVAACHEPMCTACAWLVCPSHELNHFHYDGCPTCVAA